MFRTSILCAALVLLAACQEEEVAETSEPPVRALKTITIEEVEETTTRRYPSVLQPGSISTLSFEVSGRLKEVDLNVGQRVSQGDLIAELDTTSLEIQVETAQASLDEANSLAK
ncbi:MAG: biotin/lipoyl-binding protein, partial [Pseudomonadota bacterium]